MHLSVEQEQSSVSESPAIDQVLEPETFLFQNLKSILIVWLLSILPHICFVPSYLVVVKFSVSAFSDKIEVPPGISARMPVQVPRPGPRSPAAAAAWRQTPEPDPVVSIPAD
jgi:hypothetical protein